MIYDINRKERKNISEGCKGFSILWSLRYFLANFADYLIQKDQ